MRRSSNRFRHLHAVVQIHLGLFLSSPGAAQTVLDEFWMPDGPVHAIAVSDDAVYLGGDFTRLVPPTGGLVSIDLGTGQVGQPYPLVNGSVGAIVSDGSGGWYIGGAFTKVKGQPRQNLAHLDAAGNVSAWDPSPDGPVSCMVVDVASGALYVGGSFTSVGGQSRAAVARFDAVAGTVSSWNANVTSTIALAAVRAMVLRGSTLYVAGSFTSVGGAGRNHLAALDAQTAAPTSWNPTADRPVDAMILRALDAFPFTVTLYVGGGFDNVGGQPRARLAAIDGTTGLATSWNPGADGQVQTLIRTGGILTTPLTIYAAGTFQNVGGQPRKGLVAIDATGQVKSWNPDPDGAVWSLAATGSLILAGGVFEQIGGAARSGLAALDANGAATSWNPGVVLGGALALHVSGNSVLVGGTFLSAGAGVARDNLAALDLTTGQPTSFDPGADGIVRALAAYDGVVYAGGQFSTAGGQPRAHAVALDGTTGAVLPWNPSPDGEVRALVVRPLAINRVLVHMGGDFTTVGGEPRANLAAMENGPFPVLSSWAPTVNGLVLTLAIDGSRVYAGGLFDAMPSPFSNYVAAFDFAGAWDPDFQANANGPVHAIAFDENWVYVGGSFSRVGFRDRARVGVLDRRGFANTWDPYVDGVVDALAVAGSDLYIGGTFDWLGAESRNGFATFDLSTGLVGALTPVDPRLSGITDVNAITVRAGSLFVGGLAFFDGKVQHFGFAALGDGTSVTSTDVAPGVRPLRLKVSSNPFRDRIEVSFALERDGVAELTVFDTRGRLVRRLAGGHVPSGESGMVWDGRDQAGAAVAPGTYFLRLQTRDTIETAKVLRLD